MRPRPTVVVVGDVVLDRDLEGHVTRVCPDAPVPVVDVDEERSGPGGAGLTALLCLEEKARVTLVAAIGDDEAGELVRQQLTEAGVTVIPLAQDGETRRKTRVRAAGQSLLRVDSGGPARPTPELPQAAVEAIELADVVLVSCYGAGSTEHRALREVLARRAQLHPVVWDPHPRGGFPVPGCALVSPNLGEARGQLMSPDDDTANARELPGDVMAARLRDRWSARAVAVTAGSRGAWLATSAGEPMFVPAAPVAGDSCGAGDRFASAAAVALARGRTTSESVVEAVEAASAFVAASGASGFRRRLMARRAGFSTSVQASGLDGVELDGALADRNAHLSARAVVESVRALGGTVVATGGCFDVLHAGHVQTLEAARQLGDSLVVLLNSDESVTRLKGPGRPVQPQHDRAEVLRSLGCVDAVVIFDEDEPSAALASLRPDVWAKGGDYEGAELAESELVRSWGGRVVLLPYLTGRSTTAILRRDLTGVQHDRA